MASLHRPALCVLLFSLTWLPGSVRLIPWGVLPPTWRVTTAVLADVTGDGRTEWVLVVWRPWRDLPVERWSTPPSPVAGFHDPDGASCHLVLLDSGVGREVWAGSALPIPIVALAVADVDDDGRAEVLVGEGEYNGDRRGPVRRFSVWKWNGFGFWRVNAPGRRRGSRR